MGFGSRFEQRNLACVSYLLDLLFLGAAGCESSEEVCLTAAMVVVCSVNTSEVEQITSASYRLNQLAVRCLEQLRVSAEEAGELGMVLEGVMRKGLWRRLARVGAEGRVGESAEERVRWMDRLELVSFCEEGEGLLSW